MYCPMASLLNYAYQYKYYPKQFEYMIKKAKATELMRTKELKRPFSVFSSNPKYNAEYVENVVKNKWVKILNEKEKSQQISMFGDE